MRKIFHFFIYALLAILVVLIDLSFLQALPWEIYRLQLTVIVLVFLRLFADEKIWLWWLAGAGYLLEIFSFMTFGLHILALSLAALAAHYLLLRWVTNRSVYAAALAVVVAVLFYDGVFWLYDYFFSASNDPVVFETSFMAQLRALCYNGLLGAIIFYLINLLTKRFSPVFLRKFT
ncbi:MAG: hypothetical protein QY321_01880 [Patescibacteria group bacterium]|nr:MAG: hypothetical protein QY321_01880 [Patescibacteria group bacterium]